MVFDAYLFSDVKKTKITIFLCLENFQVFGVQITVVDCENG